MVEGERPIGPIEIVAHRGASAYEPENTLRAIRRAMEFNVDAIEVDLRASRDGSIVAIHDDRLDRTTTGKGYVRDHDLAALRELDAGLGEKIPTLLEVLGAVNHAVPLLLEIKEPATVATVAAIVRDHEAEGWVRIISFFEAAIRTAASALPRSARGLIVARAEDLLDELAARCLEIGAQWLLPRHTMTTRALVEAARRHGLRVLSWTIDDPSTARRVASFGVDGIATNRPDIRMYLS